MSASPHCCWPPLESASCCCPLCRSPRFARPERPCSCSGFAARSTVIYLVISVAFLLVWHNTDGDIPGVRRGRDDHCRRLPLSGGQRCAGLCGDLRVRGSYANGSSRMLTAQTPPNSSAHQGYAATERRCGSARRSSSWRLSAHVFLAWVGVGRPATVRTSTDHVRGVDRVFGTRQRQRSRHRTAAALVLRDRDGVHGRLPARHSSLPALRLPAIARTPPGSSAATSSSC